MDFKNQLIINGEKIREIRKNKGLEQSDLAAVAGVSVSYISQIERGVRKNPSIDVLYAIANKLEVNVDDLLKNVEILEKNEIKSEKIREENDQNIDLDDQAKLLESMKFDSPEEALKFILQQPVFMAYGGYDLKKLSEEEIIELANDMLLAMRISLEKKKRQ